MSFFYTRSAGKKWSQLIGINRQANKNCSTLQLIKSFYLNISPFTLSSLYLKIQYWSSFGRANATWVTTIWKQRLLWMMWRAHHNFFFKFRVEGGDVDKSYVHCRLCLVEGGSACQGRASPRTTWSFECMFVWFYDKMTINHGTHDDCFKTELFSWWYICINRICINRRLIGTPF